MAGFLSECMAGFVGIRTVVLKARGPARIMTAIGNRAANRWHLQFAERWVVQYNFMSTTPAGAECSSACGN
jgi:hypothetical protein